jgi:hypothetical protein
MPVTFKKRKKNKTKTGTSAQEAHAYNPSYLGGRDQEDHHS